MSAFDILVITLGNILCVAIGYYAGHGGTPESAIKEVERVIRKRTGAVGPVTRPPAEKVILWHKPKELEEQEAFKKSFQEQTGKEHP